MKKKSQPAKLPRITNKSRQTDLDGTNLDEQDEDKWGDMYATKGENCMRVGFQNIQGLPVYSSGTKNFQIAEIMDEMNLDVFGMAELNLHWKNLDNFDGWHERTRNVSGCKKSVIAYNTKENTKEKKQFGGVAMIIRGDWVHRAIETGIDERKLGRWVWTKFRGKKDNVFRVICTYKPVDSTGESTVAEQHRRAYANDGLLEEQEKIFIDDLRSLIQSWVQKGECVIMMGDINQDVRKGSINDMLEEQGMTETITGLHGNRGPATQQRNTSRTPIDGIWVSINNRADRAGYLEFGAGISSDHRLIWAELDKRDLLGLHIPGLARIQPRRLNSGNPAMVDEYNERVCEAFEEKKIFQALESLRKVKQWEDSHTRQFNKIVETSVSIRNKVEEGLRKLRTGGVEWFPELQFKRDEIKLWLSILKKRNGGKVGSKVLKRREKKVMIYDTKLLATKQVQDNLNMAFKEYKKLKKEAPAKREEFLQTIAEGRAARNNTEPESELKKMQEVEKQRKLARKLNSTRTKKQRTATIKVFCTTEGERQECVSQEDVEKACIQENKRRFTQSRGTPFLKEPLLDIIGYMADTEAADQILEGTFQIPSTVDKYTALLIKELKRPPGVKEISTSISDEENKQAWKKAKERTSSIGLHFGHLKSATFDEQLNRFDAGIREIPYRHGLDPNGWKNITDVAILKKAGVYDVEKMRTIQLMDSYFNMNNKKLGKDLMAYAEEHKLIAKEQYGSRKKHRSVLAALNKRLTMDILRQKRKTGAIIVNDAVSCYDRIVHAIAILSMRRLGAPKSAVTSMFRILQKAIHKVRTAFGDSAENYMSEEYDVRLHGMGQGNGCGPTGWASISTPIINMLRKAQFGAFFLAALSMSLLHFVCYAFVDDTDLVHVAQDNEYKGEEFIPQIQEATDHWEGGLRATGGAINTARNKTYWILFEYTWTKKGWRLVDEEEVLGEITVRDVSGELREPIARKSPMTGHETLGIFIAGDGSEKEEKNYLRKEAMAFADWINKSKLNPYEINHAVRTTIMKTFEYPMEAICMDRKEWKSVMSNVLRVGLPGIGVCRNYPRDVVYGPSFYQGLGWQDPYLKQYLIHIKTIVQEEARKSLTGELLQISMEQTKLELGMPNNLTDVNESSWNWTEKRTWVRKTINFMNEIEMRMDDGIEIEKQRINDVFIMERFLTIGYSDQQMFILNCCRMNCRAVTLADITTGDGKFIKDCSLKAMKDELLTTKYDWPRIVPLDNNWIDLWVQALIAAFNLTACNGKWKLDIPLGAWFKDDESWSLRYKDEVLFRKEQGAWFEYRKTRATRNNMRYSCRGISELPIHSQRATGKMDREIILFTGSAEHLSQHHRRPTDPYEARFQLDQTEKWAIGQWVWPQNWQEIAEEIRLGNASAVSDGSFKDEYGTSAFTIGNFQTNMLGVNVAPGEPEDQQSQRSELAGIVGILTVTKILCKVSLITQGKLTIGLDALNVVRYARSCEVPSPEMADFDLWICVYELLKEIPITIDWVWIEGHQDDEKEWHELDNWAKFNVYMDNVAKQYWNYANTRNIRPYKKKLFGETRALFWHGKKLSRFRINEIYEEQSKDVIGDYWIHKDQLSADTVHTVDWEILRKMTLKLPFQRRVWLSQQMTGIAGVNHWLHRWGKTEHHECPVCNAPHETTEHVILCQDQRAKDQWEDSLANFRENLEKINTPMTLISEIINGLRQWRNGRRAQAVHEENVDLIRDQNRIGWRNFIYGRVSLKWKERYMEIEEDTPSRSKRWLSAMIEKLLKVAWDQWQFRNAIKHSDDHPLVAEQKEAVKNEINLQFLHGTDNLLSKDKHRLLRPKEEIFKKSLEAQLMWVESMKAARMRFEEKQLGRNDEELERMRKFLADWLGKE